MTVKHFLLSFLLLVFSINTFAVKDSTMVIPMINGGISLQIPSGGIAKRFGINASIGTDFTLKTRNNFLIGCDFEFIFGNKIKEKNIFKNILTEDGYIINKDGEFANVILSQRGFYLGGKIGKQFPILKDNLNSGIFFTIGSGLLQYKTRIEVESNNVPNIIGEYAKGYDRLTNGLAFKEFIGYRFLSKKQTVNFYIGFEFYQAFTKNRRSIDFSSMQKDENLYKDYLYSLRFGWIIPIYKRVPQEFYFD